MIPTSGNPLAEGALVALDRDRAKQLFGARGSDALKAFLAELVESEPPGQDGRIVCCRGMARPLQEVLDTCPSVDDDSRPALQQAIWGGRPLSDEPDLQVRLVRPDLVPHVAEGAREFEHRCRGGTSADGRPPGRRTGQGATRVGPIAAVVRRCCSGAMGGRVVCDLSGGGSARRWLGSVEDSAARREPRPPGFGLRARCAKGCGWTWTSTQTLPGED